MLKKLKKNIYKLKEINLSRFDMILLGVIVIVNALVLIASYQLNSIRFTLAYLQYNFLQVIVIGIVAIALFVVSYKQIVKRNPSVALISVFVLIWALFVFSLISITSLSEQITHKATFSTAQSIFILFAGLFFSTELSRYDLLSSDSIKTLYLRVSDHVTKYIGVYFVIASVISIVGFLNRTFIYGIVAIIITLNLYICKAFLANLRK